MRQPLFAVCRHSDPSSAHRPFILYFNHCISIISRLILLNNNSTIQRNPGPPITQASSPSSFTLSLLHLIQVNSISQTSHTICGMHSSILAYSNNALRVAVDHNPIPASTSQPSLSARGPSATSAIQDPGSSVAFRLSFPSPRFAVAVTFTFEHFVHLVYLYISDRA